MEEIERFDGRTSEGKRYTIVRYQHYRHFRPLSGPPQKLKTTQELFTDNGLDVNQIDENTYQIVQTDEIVLRS